MKEIHISTIPMLRDRLIKTAEALQRLERCAAAITPYPGGVIAFGSRDAILSMLSDADE